jgi:hypothetical protein
MSPTFSGRSFWGPRPVEVKTLVHSDMLVEIEVDGVVRCR